MMSKDIMMISGGILLTLVTLVLKIKVGVSATQQHPFAWVINIHNRSHHGSQKYQYRHNSHGDVAKRINSNSSCSNMVQHYWSRRDYNDLPQSENRLFEVYSHISQCITVLFVYPANHWLFQQQQQQSDQQKYHHFLSSFAQQVIDPDVNFIGFNALLAGHRHSCQLLQQPHHQNDDNHGEPYLFGCQFAVTFTEPGVYNITVRGDDFALRIEDMNSSTYAWDGMFGKEYMGRYRELYTPYLQQLEVLSSYPYPSKESKRSSFQDDLPLCTFEHESRMWHSRNQGSLEGGHSQWKRYSRMMIEDEEKLRSLWYNDSYLWVNDICRYKPYSGDEILEAMERRNITNILLVGDSLTKFMLGDFEQQFSGCTQQWLLDHPIVMWTDPNTNETKTSWDHAFSIGFGHVVEQAGQCYRQIGIKSFPSCCESHDDSRRQKNTCTHHNGIISLQAFHPGLNDSSSANHMPAIYRSVTIGKQFFVDTLSIKDQIFLRSLYSMLDYG
jgi:hypothetical protein